MVNHVPVLSAGRETVFLEREPLSCLRGLPAGGAFIEDGEDVADPAENRRCIGGTRLSACHFRESCYLVPRLQ